MIAPLPESQSYPRAFARGSGFVFQTVGAILFFGGCCIGPIVGYVGYDWRDPPASDPSAGYADTHSDEPPEAESVYSISASTLVGANFLIGVVMGLALLVFGFGLQQERRGSSLGAVVTTVLLSALLWGTAIVGIFNGSGPAHWIVTAITAVLAIGATLLVLMALAAHREMRLKPPPPDEPVTDEYLEELAIRRRRERGNEF